MQLHIEMNGFKRPAWIIYTNDMGDESVLGFVLPDKPGAALLTAAITAQIETEALLKAWAAKAAPRFSYADVRECEAPEPEAAANDPPGCAEHGVSESEDASDVEEPEKETAE